MTLYREGQISAFAAEVKDEDSSEEQAVKVVLLIVGLAGLIYIFSKTSSKSDVANTPIKKVQDFVKEPFKIISAEPNISLRTVPTANDLNRNPKITEYRGTISWVF